MAASRASQQLLDALNAEYGRATALPRHGAITADMRGYYAFNYRRYAHAIARTLADGTVLHAVDEADEMIESVTRVQRLCELQRDAIRRRR